MTMYANDANMNVHVCLDVVKYITQKHVKRDFSLLWPKPKIFRFKKIFIIIRNEFPICPMSNFKSWKWIFVG